MSLLRPTGSPRVGRGDPTRSTGAPEVVRSGLGRPSEAPEEARSGLRWPIWVDLGAGNGRLGGRLGESKRALLRTCETSRNPACVHENQGSPPPQIVKKSSKIGRFWRPTSLCARSGVRDGFGGIKFASWSLLDGPGKARTVPKTAQRGARGAPKAPRAAPRRFRGRPKWSFFRILLGYFFALGAPRRSGTHFAPIWDPFWSDFDPILDPFCTDFEPNLGRFWIDFELILVL